MKTLEAKQNTGKKLRKRRTKGRRKKKRRKNNVVSPVSWAAFSDERA